jgi:hypothetical protein
MELPKVHVVLVEGTITLSDGSTRGFDFGNGGDGEPEGGIDPPCDDYLMEFVQDMQEVIWERMGVAPDVED